MSVKISDLTAATEVDNGDLLAIVDVSDLTMGATGTTKKIDVETFRREVLAYTSYVVFFAQTTTSAPTITVAQNNTGETFTWARNGVGQYNVPIPMGIGTLHLPFASDYANGATTQKVIDGSGLEIGSLTLYQDGTTLRLHTYDLTGAYVEYSSLLGNTVISLPEFRFYQ